MGRTVFLTGGSSGIGKAISQELEEAEWRVIAPTRQELDLADLDRVTEFVLSESFPAKDILALVHVAGIWHDADSTWADKAFGDFKPEQISQTINVGLTSFLLLASQLLAKGEPSHIIGISGTFESGAKGWLGYYTSKRALEDFLAGLSQDYPALKTYGISPADTATPAYQYFYPEYATSAQSPDTIAKLVVSLLDGKTEYASGDIIEIRDGKQKAGFHS